MRRTLLLLFTLLTACGPATLPDPTEPLPTAPPTAPLPANTPNSPPAQPQPTKPSASLPDGVLVVFSQEGGFAYSNSALTINGDGSATLESTLLTQSPKQWTISADDLTSLQGLLSDPALAGLSIHSKGVCADCYEYTITATTPGGKVLLKFDDSDVGGGLPPPLGDLLALLAKLKDEGLKGV